MEEKELFLAALNPPNPPSHGGIYITLKVIPSAQKTEIKELMDDGETWKIRVAAIPEKGRANKEILQFFKKKFGIEAEIISGKTSSRKLVKIQ